jgi:endonuclease G
MATSKKNTKKKPPQKKNPAKKSKKTKKTEKKVKKRLNYSTIVIILITLAIFIFLKTRDDDKSMGSIDSLNTQVQTETTTTGLDAYELAYYYPTANLNNGGIVEHLAYSLDYNEDHEQADWVFYELTKEEVLNKAVPRKDKFISDPSQSITSASPKDYYKSGYDRGHLCPAADNRWSQQAMEESFYMSNMTPQHPDLNRKIWAELEKQVRDWAIENGKVYVATGPILNDGIKVKIGSNQVSVPNYYYKVVADLSGDEIKGVGFIFSNGENNGQLKNYAFPIDMIEERTNIDFFYKLDDTIEKKIETEFKMEDWF